MNRRQKIIISVTGIFLVMLILVGLTYAYFLTQITGNTKDKSISVTTANLQIKYEDGTNIILDENTKLIPSNTPIGTKTFTVKNEGDVTSYAVVLENVVNELVNYNDLRITVTCTSNINNNSCNGLEDSFFPLYDDIILNNSIEQDEIHNYEITLTYSETGKDQSIDMGKTIQARINIEDVKNVNYLLSSNLEWENGSMNFTSYWNSSSKLRTKKDTFVYLKRGDKVLLNDKTNFKYQLFIETDEGFLLGNSGYLVEDYTVMINGKYRFLITKVDESAIDISSGEQISIIRNGYIDSNKFKFVAHRGLNGVAPENTLISFRKAKEYGFKYVEADVAFTSDGIPVLLHDETIDRTSNGSGKVVDLSYQELLQYDFGSYFSDEYNGIKIATLDEFLALCVELNLYPYLDLGSGKNEERIRNIVSKVKDYGLIDKTTWVDNSDITLSLIHSIEPSARLDLYVSEYNDSLLSTLEQLKGNDNEVVLSIVNNLNISIESTKKLEKIQIKLEALKNGQYSIPHLNSYYSGITTDSILK